MNTIVKHTFFINIFAILFALLEIEMEGKHGWAEKLPTVASGLGMFTMYHIYMNIIVILVVFYTTQLLNVNIWTSIHFIILWFLVEDVAWFILNPYYTLKKYTKEDIWWHGKQKWIYGIPMHNIVGIGFLVLTSVLSENKNIIYSYVITLTIGVFVIYIAPYYHGIYKKLRNKND